MQSPPPQPPQQRQCCLPSPLKIARFMRYVALLGAVANLCIYMVHVQTKTVRFELWRQGAPETVAMAVAIAAVEPARASSQSASENSTPHHRALLVAHDAPTQSSLSRPDRPSSSLAQPPRSIPSRPGNNINRDIDNDDDSRLRGKRDALTPPPSLQPPQPPITDINDTAIPASMAREHP